MAAELHSPTAEELMEYLDGEGTPASRAAIGAHLASCSSCQALASEQQGTSRSLAAWQVAPQPGTLRAPELPRRSWTLPRWLTQPRAAAVTLSAAAVAMIAFTLMTPRVRQASAPQSGRPEMFVSLGRDGRRSPSGGGGSVGGVAGGLPDAPAAPAPADPARRAAAEVVATEAPTAVRALIRTATVQIVAADFSHVRAVVERSVEDAGGFADQLAVSADPGAARVLRATLRVPGDRLAETLARLRALGQVTQDQQNAQDVSDQLVDLDARLKNARATEQRLTDLLRERTGKLSDVLEVEQEVSRVRLEIEQLDAQKTNMSRRVAYAAIELTVSEERKAGLEPGPLSLWTQVRLAAADGAQNVVDTLVGLLLFALRAGPMVMLWGSIVAGLWIGASRLYWRRRQSPG